MLEERRPMRWCIVARRDHEDMQAVMVFGSTYKRALDLVVKEVELAKQAIAEIRRQAWAAVDG